MMIAFAYIRCNGGDYFIGEYCPLDNWSSPESKELTEVVNKLKQENRDISIDELRRAGLSDAALRRTIVIQFGSEASAFEAITPQGYVIQGEWKPLAKAGPDFK